MPAVSLTKYIKLAGERHRREVKHLARAARLNADSTSLRFQPGFDAVVAALRVYKKIDMDVVKDYLYDLGYSDDEARLLLWSGVNSCHFDFDEKFNVTRWPAPWKRKHK